MGSRLHIVVIAEATAFASGMLDAHLMAVPRQFSHSRRGHTHAVLIVLNLLGDSYFHNATIF